ncbi:MAG: hypothetical protein HY738_24185, partial [Bacteroidia bacterium]|nr:hypothetical protein [Bacteroidia bacterium]
MTIIDKKVSYPVALLKITQPALICIIALMLLGSCSQRQDNTTTDSIPTVPDSQGHLTKGIAISEGSDSEYGDPSTPLRTSLAGRSESKPLFKTYTYEDGFLGIGVNGGNNGKNVYEADNGTIWIAANDRLTAYHPEGDIPDTIPPCVQLTSIELFNEPIAWVNLCNRNVETSYMASPVAKDTTLTLGNGVKVGDFEFDGITKWYGLPENLSLAYNNNYLTFNYIGITQKQSKKVKYQYKLEGIDESWSAITSRTEAPYGNLPQGNYTFKVKAMNSEGYWSKEFTYGFTIRPPWWETWWFRTLGIVFIITVIIA